MEGLILYDCFMGPALEFKTTYYPGRSTGTGVYIVAVGVVKLKGA